jgi:hypothetical protein
MASIGVEHFGEFERLQGRDERGTESGTLGDGIVNFRLPMNSAIVVVKAWRDLPEAVRAGIAAMVKAARKAAGD